MHPRGAHSKPSQHAFTLAEVMIASVVLLLAIVGLIQAVTVGVGMLNVSRKQTVALQIIRAEIESVHLSNGWTDTIPADSTIGPVRLEDMTASGTLGYPELLNIRGVGQGFTLTRTVHTVRSAPSWLRKVTFSVTWSDSNGHSYTRAGYTYCAKNGINVFYQH